MLEYYLSYDTSITKEHIWWNKDGGNYELGDRVWRHVRLRTLIWDVRLKSKVRSTCERKFMMSGALPPRRSGGEIPG